MAQPSQPSAGAEWMSQNRWHGQYGCNRRWGAGKFFFGAAAGAGAFYLFSCTSEEGRRKWKEHKKQTSQVMDDIKAIRQALDNGGKITITAVGKEDAAPIVKQITG